MNKLFSPCPTSETTVAREPRATSTGGYGMLIKK